MIDLLKRHRPGSDSGAARLTLGAFGKHPGWDDHILGIGVETETLAQLKQDLYIGGIRAQVDSGAWEKLDADKRLAGFDHTFLAVRPGHVLLGQLWSSTDGKGRAKYPMVLCIDGEGVSPGFMLSHLLPGIERLRSACKMTVSAEQVARDCQSAQEQLRSMLGQDPARLLDGGPGIEARRRFVENPRLGPDRLGFLRVLHELKSAPAMSAAVKGPTAATVRSLRSSHLRLPLAADTPNEGLLLWAALLGAILPENVPLLLIARAGLDWLDVLINEPAPDDLFCLQAAAKAVPLATDIPYQLAPDLAQRWQEIEAKFLRQAATSPSSSGATVPPPAPAGMVPPKNPPRAQEKVLPVRPPPAPSSPGPQRKSSKAPFVAAGAILLVVVLGVIWFVMRPSKATDRPQSAANQQTSGTATSAPAASIEQIYQTALDAARTAQKTQDFTNAIAETMLALKSKPGDADASKLLEDLKQAASVANLQQQKYAAATNAAALALLQMNYQEATNQAAVALLEKPADPTALKLLADGQQGLAVASRQQQYQSALDKAKSAFSAANYAEATQQAAVALALRPGDPTATKIQADARAAADTAAQGERATQKYASATNAAATALTASKFQDALAQAAIALTVRSNDATALKLKSQAEGGLALAKAQDYFAQGDYAKASELCQARVGDDQFTNLVASIASEQKSLADAAQSLSNADYASLDNLKSQPFTAKAPFAKLLSQAADEKAALDSLLLVKQTNGWQEVKRKLATPEFALLVSKPPFADLRTWADSQPTPAATVASPSSNSSVQTLDAQFEVLLVNFGVLSARDAQSAAGRNAKLLQGGVDTDYYLKQTEKLRTAYTSGNWLDDLRQKRLNELRKQIEHHE